jgi:hypothetical protein
MAADDQFESVRYGGVRRRHDEPAGTYPRTEASSRCRSHRGRGLTGGDHTHVVHTFRSARYFPLSSLRERRVDEGAGLARSDTGPDNRQEIVSKIRE